MKLFESERVLAFMDIQPLSRGHALVIPKFHAAKLADVPDEDLKEILIPKPNESEGLGVHWPITEPGMEKLQEIFEEIKAKM
ncbi:MAG: Histidine triad nucleotide-binding protein 2, mitochondrial [Vezdaea aestivalis]|nr:MAG: Histidine triad nucleotide-binding protein 2, mitochondrial [Vezdaea aestivalis]